MSTPQLWLVSVWTLMLAASTVLLARDKLRRPVRLVTAGLTIVALIPVLPSSHAEPPKKPSRQVVYRFDAYRYLTLEGYGCEGAINYVDDKRGIDSPMIEQFARVFLPRFVHADDNGNFIFVPYHEPSAFRVSYDQGKTFEDAWWVGTRYFGAENISAITVVNQQAFIETKDGRLFMTSKPFGEGWGRNVIDPVNELPTHVFDRLPEFQNLPRKVPEVKNYAGWTEMHCDPDLEGEPIETLGTRWNRLQADVLGLLGRSVALPVTLVASMFR